MRVRVLLATSENFSTAPRPAAAPGRHDDRALRQQAARPPGEALCRRVAPVLLPGDTTTERFASKLLDLLAFLLRLTDLDQRWQPGGDGVGDLIEGRLS